MRFKLDENMPRLARERRIIVKLDTDFADTRRYDPGCSPGVIVLRPHDQSIRAVLQCLDGVLRALATEPIEATLWLAGLVR